MKKFIFVLSLGIASLGLAGQAQATTVSAAAGINSFSFFDDINGDAIAWDVLYTPLVTSGVIEYDNGAGTVDDVAAGHVRLTGNNLGTGISFTQMTTTNDEAFGINVSFDWDYTTSDLLAEYDPFVFIKDLLSIDPLDFVEVTLTGATAGNAIFQVASMAQWGFSQDSDDGLWGAGITDISNLSFTQASVGPSPVPVPPALLLFGTAIAGLGFARRKRQSAAV